MSASPADISIVTCSADDARFATFKANVETMFPEAGEIIRIRDASSIAEGYNRGAAMASGRILVFCHDDIEFLNTGTAEFIREDLVDFDIIGVAGTSRMVEGRWIGAGQPYIHGQVVHALEEQEPKYQLSVYGLGRDDTVVSGIQALDGLLMAVHRRVLGKVRFDAAMFDGFHLYDLDFSYGACLSGFKLAVDHRIGLLHASSGVFKDAWHTYRRRFEDKYGCRPAGRDSEASCVIKGLGFNSKRLLAVVMRRYGDGNRVFIEQLPNPSNPLQKITLLTDKEHRDLVVPPHQRLPLDDDCVDYIQIQLITIAEDLLHEIFRVCRQGAMVELLITLPGSENQPQGASDHLRDFLLRSPQAIQFSHGETKSGQFICKGVTAAGAARQRIYFQTVKAAGV